MLILGVDPGAVTGWAVYESADRRVIASGQFNEHQITAGQTIQHALALLVVEVAKHGE